MARLSRENSSSPRARGSVTDSPEAIQRRLAMAKRELEHFGDYDYLVVNDNLDRAHQQLNAIVEAARCSRAWCGYLADELLTEGASAGIGATVTPLVPAPHD